MNIPTILYCNLLNSKGIRRRFWNLLRKVLVRVTNDAPCSMMVHGRLLKMPLSHALPVYLKSHKCYDRLPGRLSEFLDQAKGTFKLIDVGANIGDTIAAFYRSDRDCFLAIEPNPKFNKCLTENWSQNGNVKIISTICSSEDETGTFSINEGAGTASISRTTDGVTMKRQPLDAILDELVDFRDANILKVDTDGHDFEVLKGARKFIETNKPAVLFECDVFDNSEYVSDVTELLSFFREVGYGHVILYDNFGYMVGRYSLADVDQIRKLLFYQLTSKHLYYDALLMVDEDLTRFYEAEAEFYLGELTDGNLRSVARAAL